VTRSIAASGVPVSASETVLPTEAKLDAAARCPAASVETARYSTRVPVARPAVSWKTRGVVSSAVPRLVHAVSPTTRQAKPVSCQVPSSTVAPTGETPVTPAPAAGAATVIAAAAAGALTGRSATSTTEPRAGTVTARSPVSPDTAEAVSPNSTE